MFKIFGYQGEKKTSHLIPSAPFQNGLSKKKKKKKKTRRSVGEMSQNPCTLLMRMEISMGAAQTTGSRTIVD